MHTNRDAVSGAQLIHLSADYIPDPDLDRFPRKAIHVPKPEENKNKGWATRVTVQDTQPNDGPLKGRTFAVKDNYAVAGVIANNGTPVCGDWVPKLDAEIVQRCLKAGATVSMAR